VKGLAEAAAETATEALTVLSATAAAAEIVVERARRREPTWSGSAPGRAILGGVHA
jgi:hypothetical protein